MQLQCEKRLKILSVYVSKSLFLFFSTEIFRGIFETFCVFEIFCDIWIFFFFFQNSWKDILSDFTRYVICGKASKGIKWPRGPQGKALLLLFWFFFNFPRPHPPRGCESHVLSTWRHVGAVTRPAVDWHLNRKTLWVQRVQLSFAFSPIFINHFKYFIRKLESTVSSVMSHVSPANFQALDQRVS